MSIYKLKIGLDYHGVIDKKTSYFAKFCKEARSRGHRIYIITGGPAVKIKELLAESEIPYDFIFAISDYYQALGMVKQIADGSLVIPQHLWDKAKADFCKNNKINFHIDDSLDYMHWFSTPFCLYDTKGDICYLSPGLSFNLSQSPQEVIKVLEKISENFINIISKD